MHSRIKSDLSLIREISIENNNNKNDSKSPRSSKNYSLIDDKDILKMKITRKYKIVNKDKRLRIKKLIKSNLLALIYNLVSFFFIILA